MDQNLFNFIGFLRKYIQNIGQVPPPRVLAPPPMRSSGSASAKAAEAWSKPFQGNKSLQNASSGIGKNLMQPEGVKVWGGIRGMQIRFSSFVLQQ